MQSAFDLAKDCICEQSRSLFKMLKFLYVVGNSWSLIEKFNIQVYKENV